MLATLHRLARARGLAGLLAASLLTQCPMALAQFSFGSASNSSDAVGGGARGDGVGTQSGLVAPFGLEDKSNQPGLAPFGLEDKRLSQPACVEIQLDKFAPNVSPR